MSGARTFSLTSQDLKEMLSKSVFAAAREDSRHVLNGVLMKVSNSLATFIGTDGKRLAKVTTPIDIDNDYSNEYLIPLKAVEEIVKSLNSDHSVKISLSPVLRLVIIANSDLLFFFSIIDFSVCNFIN